MKKILLAVSLLASLLAFSAHAVVPANYKTGVFVKERTTEHNAPLWYEEGETFVLTHTFGELFDENGESIDKYAVSVLAWNCGGDTCYELGVFGDMTWSKVVGENKRFSSSNTMMPLNFPPFVFKNDGGSVVLHDVVATEKRATVTVDYFGGDLDGTSEATLKPDFKYCGPVEIQTPTPAEGLSVCNGGDDEGGESSSASSARSVSSASKKFTGTEHTIKFKSGKKFKFRF